MYKDFFNKEVVVILKSGEKIKGKFTDAFSEFDNNGPATLIIGSTEIKEREIKEMNLLSTQK